MPARVDCNFDVGSFPVKLSMVKSKDKEYKLFTRRAILIGGVQCAALAGLAGRMAWLQVVHGEKYATLADKNRINVRLLAPERGLIVDRYGVPLANNDQNFRVLLIPEQTKDIDSVLASLERLITLKQHHIQTTFEQVKRKPAYLPVEIRDGLSWKDVSTIEVNIMDLPGVMTDAGTRRSYPHAGAAAHLVGYVGAVTRKDLGKNKVFSLPGFKVGKSGIEKSYDDALRGKPGRAEVEVNVNGREVRELNRQDPEKGKTIVLSIDAELQNLTHRELAKEKSASAVIMDAKDGRIYALASSPGFDPNEFARGMSNLQWEKLHSETAPLTNKAVAGHYPPGSTFKMITALAALEKGIISSNTKFTCNGHINFGDGRFHCWKEEGHGALNLNDAIAQSCDVYFYNLAMKLDINEIAEMARRFGLGEKTGLELGTERPGVIPDREWKLGFVGKRWQAGETLIASIGQGFLQTTPIQLARMTCAMVNGGRLVYPRLVSGIGGEVAPRPEPTEIPINPYYMMLIKEAMDDVTMGRLGTARGSRIGMDGMEMGGKTGTSQVRRITQEQRRKNIKNEDLPWHLRHHALFVGYAPLNAPRYVCAVVVEHGVGGSKAAAPIAKQLMIETQKRDPASKSVILDVDKLAGATEIPQKNQNETNK